jgi:hypothetical protein
LDEKLKFQFASSSNYLIIIIHRKPKKLRFAIHLSFYTQESARPIFSHIPQIPWPVTEHATFHTTQPSPLPPSPPAIQQFKQTFTHQSVTQVQTPPTLHHHQLLLRLLHRGQEGEQLLNAPLLLFSMLFGLVILQTILKKQQSKYVTSVKCFSKCFFPKNRLHFTLQKELEECFCYLQL